MNTFWYIEWLCVFLIGLSLGYLLFSPRAKIKKSDGGEMVIKISADTVQFQKDIEVAKKAAEELAAVMDRLRPMA